MNKALRLGTLLLPIIPLLIGLVSLQNSDTRAHAYDTEHHLSWAIDVNSDLFNTSPQFDDDLHDINEESSVEGQASSYYRTFARNLSCLKLKSYPIRGPPPLALS